MRLPSLVVLGAFVVSANAQGCVRPVPPPGGFPLQADLVVPVTYSDGYETFGSLLRPAGPPPTCGWPLVVFVHPLGAMRSYQLDVQQRIAGQGYAVWSYDVRGQGQAQLVNTQHPNPGTTLWGPVERVDLAEQIAFVAANAAWTGEVDATRIGVMGVSQGGAHAWSAAALSGQTIGVPGRPSIVFPTVACAIPSDLVADPIDDWVRGGELFSTWFVEAISGSYTGTPFDAAFVQAARASFVAQDAPGLVATLQAEGRALRPLLAASSVPVLYHHAWFDIVDGPLSAVQCLESRSAPFRVHLGAVGHAVPANAHEVARRDEASLRWLHRWLWNEANEIDLEPPFVLAQLPLDPLVHDDLQTKWNHALGASVLPPPTAQRWYLHDDGLLRDAAPTAPQANLAIHQQIDPLATTFTPTDYLNDPSVRLLANVLAACPLQERVYTLTTTAPSEIAASPLLHLELVPDQPSWMLAAVLTVQGPEPGAIEVMLGAQAIARHNSVAGIAEQHDVRLPPIAARIPAGATLRLRLRNLWLREWPGQSIEVAPRFHDFQVALRHDQAPAGCWLDLPLVPTKPRLVVTAASLDLATAPAITGTLRGGSERSGYPYFAAIGLSGQVPGVPYLDDVVAIDGDWLVVASAGSNEAPWFSGFLGFLDVDGNATLTLDLSSAAPLPQLLNGMQLTFAAFVWNGPWAPTGAGSNPCDVQLR